MIFKHHNMIHVYYLREEEKIAMGRLAMKDRRIFFEYDTEFLKTGLELSPFQLALKSGIIASKDTLFEGLFGVFNDSLPDGWGRLLLDRKLISVGINPAILSPLDRLSYVGSHGMGALTYEPEVEYVLSNSHSSLDEIANEVLLFQANNDVFIDDLLAMNGSSAGARPKILVKLINDELITHNHQDNDWIIKFGSSLDPKDIGAIEYAYHLMAKAAKLDVPEARLFPSKKGSGYFGVKRFDRINGKRIHMHTMSGLLHSDHRIPSLDYETIMKATLFLTRNIHECEKQLRNATFNLLAHNRDDHAKNFSFLMDKEGSWQVSPAYDLTFSSGPMGEHCTMFIGEGKNPRIDHILKLGEIVGIKKHTTLKIIDEVKDAVSKWHNFAKDSGVTKKSATFIQNSLDNVYSNFFGQ